MNYEKFSNYYMTCVNTRSDVFHSSKDCGLLTNAKNIRGRSKSYVKYHEAKPCPVCHDESEISNDDFNGERSQ